MATRPGTSSVTDHAAAALRRAEIVMRAGALGAAVMTGVIAAMTRQYVYGVMAALFLVSLLDRGGDVGCGVSAVSVPVLLGLWTWGWGFSENHRFDRFDALVLAAGLFQGLFLVGAWMANRSQRMASGSDLGQRRQR